MYREGGVTEPLFPLLTFNKCYDTVCDKSGGIVCEVHLLVSQCLSGAVVSFRQHLRSYRSG